MTSCGRTHTCFYAASQSYLQNSVSKPQLFNMIKNFLRLPKAIGNNPIIDTAWKSFAYIYDYTHFTISFRLVIRPLTLIQPKGISSSSSGPLSQTFTNSIRHFLPIRIRGWSIRWSWCNLDFLTESNISSMFKSLYIVSNRSRYLAFD